MLLIRIHNLTKRYEKLIAVDNLSLDIEQNEVLGLLGPNGAGKTTVIHMLATLLAPTSGTATVNGFDIHTDPEKVRSSIGIVFQVPSSDDLLTGYENLKLHTLLYGVAPEIREKRISDALDLVGLTDRKNDQVKKYSGGMRRRLEIARGLIHNPQVLFLDEPTLGLDPSSRETMWEYIKNLVRKEKLTIILTTHYMEEADTLCNRIAIIDKGKIIALDTPKKLKSMIGGDVVKLKLKTEGANIDNLNALPFVKKIDCVEGYVLLNVDDAKKNIPEILKHVEAESVESSSPTLNDVFLTLTGRSIKEQAEGGFMERYVQYDKH
ncbi:MAG: ATP-binding cassette domain-containing protein [Thaumarchaeota archaeon]|nr:ATP-binding cassette domain-containing protein [Nitrososphaerota archaeon]